MSSAVTISSERAADIARSIRDRASADYQRGMLDAFARGMLKGQLIVVDCCMHPEEWILQGIENEINFYCRRAQQEESRPR